MSIMNIVQLAHGEIYMIASYFVYYFSVSRGLNFYAAFVIAVLAVGVLGIVLERFFFRPFRGKPDQALVLSIGLILVFQNIVLAIAGGTPKSYNSPFEGVVNVGSLALSMERLVIIIAGFVLITALFLFIRFARTVKPCWPSPRTGKGRRCRASTSTVCRPSPCSSAAPWRASPEGWSAPSSRLTPTMGGTVLMKGIAVIILGGLGSIPGAVLGGPHHRPHRRPRPRVHDHLCGQPHRLWRSSSSSCCSGHRGSGAMNRQGLTRLGTYAIAVLVASFWSGVSSRASTSCTCSS